MHKNRRNSLNDCSWNFREPSEMSCGCENPTFYWKREQLEWRLRAPHPLPTTLPMRRPEMAALLPTDQSGQPPIELGNSHFQTEDLSSNCVEAGRLGSKVLVSTKGLINHRRAPDMWLELMILPPPSGPRLSGWCTGQEQVNSEAWERVDGTAGFEDCNSDKPAHEEYSDRVKS